MNKHFFILRLLLFAALAAEPAAAEEKFAQVTGDKVLTYPKDHGAHPEYATEWWYTTGHLKTDDGKAYGFELVFFRLGVDPRAAAQQPASQQTTSPSAWKVNSLFMAHFALTDDSGKKFQFFQRRSRGNFKQAGAAADNLNVWLKDWQLRLNGDRMELHAREKDLRLDLGLTSKKPLVLHGVNGFSVKGSAPGDASYYSSLTRLEGTGSLQLSGKTHPISRASVWFDHEFTSSASANGSFGWDWFALQCDNGEDVMIYLLRGPQGARTAYSSGTLIAADGSTTPIKKEDFLAEGLDIWVSPKTKIFYPSGWKLSLPNKNREYIITPTVQNQELVTDETTGITYWEGRATGSGTVDGKKTACEAYVELVGYAQLVRNAPHQASPK